MTLIKDHVKSPNSDQDVLLDERPIWEIIAGSGPEIPAEERNAAPHDGARNYKHYLYGHSKEELTEA